MNSMNMFSSGRDYSYDWEYTQKIIKLDAEIDRLLQAYLSHYFTACSKGECMTNIILNHTTENVLDTIIKNIKTMKYDIGMPVTRDLTADVVKYITERCNNMIKLVTGHACFITQSNKPIINDELSKKFVDKFIEEHATSGKPVISDELSKKFIAKTIADKYSSDPSVIDYVKDGETKELIKKLINENNQKKE